ncbi:hypothetical protein [Nonomuraea sp. MG754425]|uniref:hypothetical protein n=1 Tax=Nonomuraea sp. MG754425 TaxID=2570319 RepID=UPI001F45FDE3|nr:hypothetical protein [Nonomuraea sp. MG754425]
MQLSRTVKEQQQAYAKRLLLVLGKQLAARDITPVLVDTEDGRPALEVADIRHRTRRVFAHLPFCWFYWGDQHDERVSCLQMGDAVDRIERAVREGWPEGEQGDLRINLGKMLDAYGS